MTAARMNQSAAFPACGMTSRQMPWSPSMAASASAIAARLTVTLSIRVRPHKACWLIAPPSASTATSRHSGMRSPNKVR